MTLKPEDKRTAVGSYSIEGGPEDVPAYMASFAPAILPSPTRDAMQVAAERMVTQRDGIILSLLRNILSAPDLEPVDLIGQRLVCMTTIGDEAVTWYLDDKPFARFWPPEVSYEDPPSQRVNFTQRWQVL